LEASHKLSRRAPLRHGSRLLREPLTTSGWAERMAVARNTLHDLIDRLPDAELGAARRFLEFLSQEPIGPGFAASVRRAIAQADAVQTIVYHNYDEMVEELLA
jgi:hypothetical protein